jgi:HTH-type transcriptional regulator/antitoxin HigA
MKGCEKLIENEAERREATLEIERLWHAEAGTKEADRLKLLLTLVEVYEKEKFALGPPDPITAILFRMEQAGLTRADLEPIIGGRNRVSEILSGKRKLSKRMIVKLHSSLGIPLESLLEIRPAPGVRQVKARAASTRRPRGARARRKVR